MDLRSKSGFKKFSSLATRMEQTMALELVDQALLQLPVRGHVDGRLGVAVQQSGVHPLHISSTIVIQNLLGRIY